MNDQVQTPNAGNTPSHTFALFPRPSRSSPPLPGHTPIGKPIRIRLLATCHGNSTARQPADWTAKTPGEGTEKHPRSIGSGAEEREGRHLIIMPRVYQRKQQQILDTPVGGKTQLWQPVCSICIRTGGALVTPRATARTEGLPTINRTTFIFRRHPILK